MLRYWAITGGTISQAVCVLLSGLAFYAALALLFVFIFLHLPQLPPPAPHPPALPYGITFLAPPPINRTVRIANKVLIDSKTREVRMATIENLEAYESSRQKEVLHKPDVPVAPQTTTSDNLRADLIFPVTDWNELRQEGEEAYPQLSVLPALYFQDPDDLWMGVIRSQPRRKLGFVTRLTNCTHVVLTFELESGHFQKIESTNAQVWCSELRHPESEPALAPVLTKAAELLYSDIRNVRVIILWERSDLLAFLGMVGRAAKQKGVDPSLVKAVHIALVGEPSLAFKIQELELSRQ